MHAAPIDERGAGARGAAEFRQGAVREVARLVADKDSLAEVLEGEAAVGAVEAACGVGVEGVHGARFPDAH
eukprot:11208539-Lingulodinium_polyedra.AAC.1